MRKILITPVVLLIVAAIGFAGLLYFQKMMQGRADTFVSSIMQENSPIAELATRKVVWRVFYTSSTLSKDTVRDTVYTIKLGYDLAAIEDVSVDHEARIITFCLPPPKILSIDHFLQRETQEKKTFIERVFGDNRDHSEADREDVVILAENCERFHLLDGDNLRESIVTTLAAKLKALCGYDLHVDSGLPLPARVLFNAYFEEKCVDFRLP